MVATDLWEVLSRLQQFSDKPKLRLLSSHSVFYFEMSHYHLFLLYCDTQQQSSTITRSHCAVILDDKPVILTGCCLRCDLVTDTAISF